MPCTNLFQLHQEIFHLWFYMNHIKFFASCQALMMAGPTAQGIRCTATNACEAAEPRLLLIVDGDKIHTSKRNQKMKCRRNSIRSSQTSCSGSTSRSRRKAGVA